MKVIINVFPWHSGTNLKRLAGFRACPCLDNYYRLNRFGSCTQCPLGYKCTNETVNLHPGFYWIWNNEIDKEAYLTFTDKLQVENNDHDFKWITFDDILPVAYLCPFVGSCEVCLCPWVVTECVLMINTFTVSTAELDLFLRTVNTLKSNWLEGL